MRSLSFEVHYSSSSMNAVVDSLRRAGRGAQRLVAQGMHKERRKHKLLDHDMNLELIWSDYRNCNIARSVNNTIETGHIPLKTIDQPTNLMLNNKERNNICSNYDLLSYNSYYLNFKQASTNNPYGLRSECFRVLFSPSALFGMNMMTACFEVFTGGNGWRARYEQRSWETFHSMALPKREGCWSLA